MHDVQAKLAIAAALFLGLSADAALSASRVTDCVNCPEMIVIPAGQFVMGAALIGSKKPSPAEGPQHTVTIPSFAIGKYEVTQEQWSEVMADSPSASKGATLPVERVAWVDIQVFIERLNAKTGKHFRLPSESEWEYAARAGAGTQYSFGDGRI